MPHIYGVNPVLEALRSSSHRIEKLLIADGIRGDRLRAVIAEAKRAGIPVRREPRAALDRISGQANHQGVVAVAAARRYRDSYDLLAKLTSDTILVLVDGVEDPQNLGAIIRTAECAGASAVILPQRRSAHVTEVVAKTSAGAVEHLPVAIVTNLASFIDELKSNNVWVIGVEASGEMNYTEYEYTGALALVFGGEGHGLHRLVRERCDVVVRIPMAGRVTSLNVSVSVGVVLFEAVRQRAKKQ
ncbi:MAG TPA: 23S rRNA (guanosine(2251)-2'-O)-methyltransferase RlmB [Blastocatellia bacterium]|nr:23S rRNA (guanosine(2251)-2'-O)-methyltransferase RlmB [Blastocatellia bacterium]